MTPDSGHGGARRWEAIARDPGSSPQDLREALRRDPAVAIHVATNPAVDEPLRRWLWERGGRAVRQAMLRVAGSIAESPEAPPSQVSTPQLSDGVRYAPAPMPESISAPLPEPGPLLLPSPERDLFSEARLGEDEETVLRVSGDPDGEDESVTVLLSGGGNRPYGTLEFADGSTVALISRRVVLGRAPGKWRARGTVPGGSHLGEAAAAATEVTQRVVVPDAERTVSRIHLLLEWDGDGWMGTDLDSANGTLLETGDSERRLLPGRPEPVGGAIRLGSVSLTVRPERAGATRATGGRAGASHDGVR